MRLANSVLAADGSAEYGRLEVFHSGGWGTVCDNAFINRFRRSVEFNTGAADVACRQLGYQQGFQIQKLVRGNHMCSVGTRVIADTANLLEWALCSSTCKEALSTGNSTVKFVKRVSSRRHSSTWSTTCWPTEVEHIQHSNLVRLGVLSYAIKQPCICSVPRRALTGLLVTLLHELLAHPLP